MSKGWYVKVSTRVVFDVDTNIGVVASSEDQAGVEAQRILREWLLKDDYASELEYELPQDLEMGDTLWHRSVGSGEIDFDSMQVLSVTPDSDFDPDPEEDQGPSTELWSLMEAAQCLNEAYHNLPDDHPLQNPWRYQYGIEVREQLSKIAMYCDVTHRLMCEEQGYDGCFDFDFVPQFLENCVNDDFELKSVNPHTLSIYWRGI
jgi:hypothetical protein